MFEPTSFPGVTFGAGSIPGSSATSGPVRTGGATLNFGGYTNPSNAQSFASGGETAARSDGASLPSLGVVAVVAVIAGVLLLKGRR